MWNIKFGTYLMDDEDGRVKNVLSIDYKTQEMVIYWIATPKIKVTVIYNEQRFKIL